MRASAVSAWFSWLLLAAIPVLPVVLRLLVGDDPPDNAIIHESGDGKDGSQQDEPGALLEAA